MEASQLRIVLQHPGAIHLLLTDLVRPLMGRRDLAKGLLGMRNDIKVLYMSAYTDDSSIRQGEGARHRFHSETVHSRFALS
ncbi:MAG TPA: hypothetical protein VFS12_14415 [Terriglobia bacterium]|nr:hypothetical protein [Terriglobia bacterium]